MADIVREVELRVLEGPNLYFPRPAIKLTLAVPGWLRASEARVTQVALRLGVSGAATPGAPGSAHRRRFAARVAAQLTRRQAVASGARRLAVRSAPGAAPDEIVVAFPWRRRAAAEALARETARGMGEILRRSPDRWTATSGGRLAAIDPGDEPTVMEPNIPVVQVTGTNGKTTTVRLIAHLVRTSGQTVAYSSTDGVFRGDGDMVQEGDYSGFGGAAMALAEEPDVAVLETARGGLLLRGSGVRHNDVGVVTNVSADHLGLHGVETVDQLAEVKAIVTRITRPGGWDVLNADDPRVLAMRRQATGQLWLCSLYPDHPALDEVQFDGGRAITVVDGWVTWFDDHIAHRLLAVEDVPVTLAGISRPNTHNALAAAAAALAIGLPERSVVRGLRTFVLDPDRNPGRANLFRLEGRIVVIDYAHNEAGMQGLVELLNGLRSPGHEVWLTISSAGDRTDERLRAFALRAAIGTDHLSVSELERYLRGRDPADLLAQLRAGAAEAGVHEVVGYGDELTALKAMLQESHRGDIVGVTALGMRTEIVRWLESAGGSRLGPGDVKRLVHRARGARG